MYAVLYLMLHGIIWFSLSRYQSSLVSRWSLAGIVSASGIALFATVGVLPDWAVATLGQVLMAAGMTVTSWPQDSQLDGWLRPALQVAD